MPEAEEKAEQSVEEGLPEQIFPDRVHLAVFLEEVERHAQGCGASPENARRLAEFLRDKYGKGLPESPQLSNRLRDKYWKRLPEEV